MSYKLDDEFRAYMRPLNDAEREELRASIKEEGVRDSLVVWVGPEGNVLIDGYNRHEIAGALGQPVKIKKIELPSRAAARVWMCGAQLGRRNLSPSDYSEIRGRLYAGLKEVGMGSEEAAATVAEKGGVSRATVFRDAEYVDALDQLEPGEKDEARAKGKTEVKKRAARKKVGVKQAKEELAAAQATDSEATEPASAVEAVAKVDPKAAAELVMLDTNQQVRAWGAKVRAMVSTLPETPHLSPTERDMVLDNLKAATSTANRAIGVEVCWHCKGEGCKWCRDTGYFTDLARSSAPLEGEV